jgi:hypothetical protein
MGIYQLPQARRHPDGLRPVIGQSHLGKIVIKVA